MSTPKHPGPNYGQSNPLAGTGEPKEVTAHIDERLTSREPVHVKVVDHRPRPGRSFSVRHKPAARDAVQLLGARVPQPPPGIGSVQCGCCQVGWPIERTRAGRAVDGWWLCPNGCRPRQGGGAKFDHPEGRRHD